MVPLTKAPKVFKPASMQFSNTPDALLPVSRCDPDEATAVATGLPSKEEGCTRLYGKPQHRSYPRGEEKRTE